MCFVVPVGGAEKKDKEGRVGKKKDLDTLSCLIVGVSRAISASPVLLIALHEAQKRQPHTHLAVDTPALHS